MNIIEFWVDFRSSRPSSSTSIHTEIMKLARSFARRLTIKRPDLVSKLSVVRQDLDDDDVDINDDKDHIDGDSMNVGDRVPSLMSVKMTQAEKVRQLATMEEFDDLEDADTQAKKRYYEEQRKFSKKLMETEETQKPEKLVQRQKKETLWGLGGELLRRKDSNLELSKTSSSLIESRRLKSYNST